MIVELIWSKGPIIITMCPKRLRGKIAHLVYLFCSRLIFTGSTTRRIKEIIFKFRHTHNI